MLFYTKRHEEQFTIEYDEDFVSMEHYSESPSVEEIVEMSIKEQISWFLTTITCFLSRA